MGRNDTFNRNNDNFSTVRYNIVRIVTAVVLVGLIVGFFVYWVSEVNNANKEFKGDDTKTTVVTVGNSSTDIAAGADNDVITDNSVTENENNVIADPAGSSVDDTE